jgi:betaine-aldehyde dehydrogenase
VYRQESHRSALHDAVLDTALPIAVQAATVNSGQTCLAQTRLLVHRSLHDEVVDRMQDAFRRLRVGDPNDSETQQGPLVSQRQRARVEGYIEAGQSEGAKLACGGGRPEHLDVGFYVEPTIFVSVDNGMRIAQEEIFGPVLSLIPFDDEREAVVIANDSIYGLSGAVWTGDNERGLRFARQVRTGTFAVNGMGGSFKAPFGGFKQSGIGRELGPEGLTPYLEIKSISLPAGYES